MPKGPQAEKILKIEALTSYDGTKLQKIECQKNGQGKQGKALPTPRYIHRLTSDQ
ncbi:MAG: hypothetical protein KGH91_04870 [Rhodospirillales bacterium]|nr:hypothetical protein [Rhodospirillales bacterium]